MIFQPEFLIRTMDLNWSDISWGYKHGLIGWRVPIAIANSRTAESADDPLLIQLVGIEKDQDWRVGEIVEALAIRETVPEDVSKRTWLFLTLLWLYDNQDKVDNILKSLEEVYADFDYPDAISSFMPFMPPDDRYDPRNHSPEENRDRILRKLRDYLQATRLNLTDRR